MTTPQEGAAGALSSTDLIRQKLETLGLSQREAARRLGIDDRSMRYYCAGKTPVPPTVLMALQHLESLPEYSPPLEVVPELRAAFEIADRNPQPIDEFEVATQLLQILTRLDRQLTLAERRGAFAVIGALRFMSRRMYGNPAWDMYWQPLSGWTDSQGTVHHEPEVAQVDEWTISEWSQLARSALHPVLRARYADLAWEVAKFRVAATRKIPQGPAPIPPDRDDAVLAIDSYLESVERRLAHEVFDAGTYLGRAVELAASLHDSERLQRAKASLFAYMTVCESADPAYPFWLFDDIAWEQRRVLGLSAEERSAVVTALERVLALRADQTDTVHFDPHSAQDAADRLGRWRGLGPPDEQAEARRAAATAGHAMEAAAEQVPGLSAIALLERQAARYRNAGDEASAARVEHAIRRRAPDAKAELRHVSTRFEIPKEELDRWADQVAGATFEEGLQRFVAANLIRKDESDAAVSELASAAVLHARIPIQIMRDDGFSSAVIGSTEEDPDGRAIYHAASRLAASAPFVNVSMIRFREKHSVDIERLLAWLAQSPLFPDSRLALVREGLAAWFAEDWVKAIHILLPQTEAALRDLLARMGGAVMKPDRHHGGFQAIGLGEVLSHERFRTHVPEDIRFHLRILLQDPRGINLRNEFAHGLAARSMFDRGIGNWMVHLVIMLGLIRLEAGAAQPPRKPK
jgi:transcriptional regulator with XRE-family HTH domain